jgi:hypothetical protein
VRHSSSSSDEEADNIAVESSDDDADDILASSDEDMGQAESNEVENSGGELDNDKQERRETRKTKSQKKENANKQRKETQQSDDYQYEVGEFVTAMYEDVWLVAQVDINQDKAEDTHVNLNYMERVGYNQFKWPKNHDLLLTLKEDILTRCAPPGLVGSSIRANHVGLNASDARAADVALAAVVPVFYLQPSFNIWGLSTVGRAYYILQYLYRYLTSKKNICLASPPPQKRYNPLLCTGISQICSPMHHFIGT